ncbi:hypothetical protein MnTg02_00406 [bacterium MnTg02]|nr:hypothetical protein MnTg02_00406 [bacterium MnTg02]
MRTALIAVSAAFIPSVIGNDRWAFTHLAGGDPDKMGCDGIAQPGSGIRLTLAIPQVSSETGLFPEIKLDPPVKLIKLFERILATVYALERFGFTFRREHDLASKSTFCEIAGDRLQPLPGQVNIIVLATALVGMATQRNCLEFLQLDIG